MSKDDYSKLDVYIDEKGRPWYPDPGPQQQVAEKPEKPKTRKQMYASMLLSLNNDDLIDCKPAAVATFIDIAKCILLDWLEGKLDE